MLLEELCREFRCPASPHPLSSTQAGLTCTGCARTYSVSDGIPDFFIDGADASAIREDDMNRVWLLEEVAAAREVIYSECARRLEGMKFFFSQLEAWLRPDYRVLEVGTGTGHFAEWMAETCPDEARIYAFDFSWPILQRAKARTEALPTIRLFRANARGPMPFAKGGFDLVFQRLAPFGARGVGSPIAALAHLKPGGRYVFAGWEQTFTTPDELKRLGYAEAELHRFEYEARMSEREHEAQLTERRHTSQYAGQTRDTAKPRNRKEHVLIGIKPS
jgi:SAM-dependent methyltransferase